MRFNGLIGVPGDGGSPGFLQLLGEELQLTIGEDHLGTWPRASIRVERSDSSTFSLTIDGEQIMFVAEDAGALASAFGFTSLTDRVRQHANVQPKMPEPSKKIRRWMTLRQRFEALGDLRGLTASQISEAVMVAPMSTASVGPGLTAMVWSNDPGLSVEFYTICLLFDERGLCAGVSSETVV